MTDVAVDNAAADIAVDSAPTEVAAALDSSAVIVADPAPSIPTPAKAPIGAVLAAVPSNADAFAAHLLRCLQTRAGADAVLQFLCYSFRLSGAVLETLSRNALRQSAQKLIAMAFQLPPATTVVLSSAPAPPGAALALSLATKFKALSGLLSEARTINRLWGLLGLYFALKRIIARPRAKKTDSEKEGSDSVVEARFDTVFSLTQIVTLILYQVFENLAFLGSKKAIDLKPTTMGKFGLLSVRCWGTYTFMELFRLLLERTRKSAKAKDAAWAKTWNKSFFRNLAWAPLTVHWGIPGGGPLPETLVGLLAMYPSMGQMVDLWRETA
ncbi:peroxin 11c [Trichoderma arundinaceum]|uniref:Peroxin 11c n=1 Tax=Trichoderma arundinaceum TaxID=490622 RepID=A0A395NUP5_TRIAR|nr:peroxin 11c [Trichoderma arundinaceum]